MTVFLIFGSLMSGDGVGDVFAALDALRRRYEGRAPSAAGALQGAAEPLVVLCEEVLKAAFPLLQGRECQSALDQCQAAYARRLAVERGEVDDP